MSHLISLVSKQVDPKHCVDEWRPGSVSDNEFRVFSELILSRAGIAIPEEKRTLLEVRLNKRIQALGLKSFTEYLTLLLHEPDGAELTEFTNALTTNTTAFFREQFHFEYLQQHLEANLTAEDIYFWSAACSSGEEAYTLAMICEEFSQHHPQFNYKILATDIDTERLSMCAGATYDNEKLEEIPKMMQLKYLAPYASDNRHFMMAQTIRQHIKFRQHNLVDDDTSPGISFNYIFLRNVLFYFPKDYVQQVLNKLERHLEPGGLLFVGMTESLHHFDTHLIQIAPSVYQKSTR